MEFSVVYVPRTSLNQTAHRIVEENASSVTHLLADLTWPDLTRHRLARCNFRLHAVNGGRGAAKYGRSWKAQNAVVDQYSYGANRTCVFACRSCLRSPQMEYFVATGCWRLNQPSTIDLLPSGLCTIAVDSIAVVFVPLSVCHTRPRNTQKRPDMSTTFRQSVSRNSFFPSKTSSQDFYGPPWTRALNGLRDCTPY